ncbi:MAG: Gfo/Idh/MocA family oxidoreductase, partial [Chloroflexi bacterium]|nr:Gfo/Idh/MocA family oxidoreductase [Chloroflexota bacterium]
MKEQKQPVRIALIGAGFVAKLHVDGYRRIGDLDVEIVGVAASSEASARAFAQEHGIAHAYGDAEALIAREDINLVDLCVPNNLHERFALAAAAAGKHILCEKPLTGYFGGRGAAEPVGATPRALMYEAALASAERMVAAAERAGVKLIYAENWLYSPAIVKANRLAAASGGTLLEIRAQECHSGSHARYSRSWAQAGGGALLRLGSHPLGAALWLKQEEARRRGEPPIRVATVLAEVGDLTTIASFRREREHFIVDDWQDVENWSTVLLTFTDGSRAVIQASDIVLGGIEDTLEMLLSNCHIKCDFSHSNLLTAYAPRDDIFGQEYIMEKVSTKAGWNYASVDEEYLMGYPQEMRDAVECVAWDHEPRSTGRLGLEVVQAIYAAYRSAEEGRRIHL